MHFQVLFGFVFFVVCLFVVLFLNSFAIKTRSHGVSTVEHIATLQRFEFGMCSSVYTCSLHGGCKGEGKLL